MGTAHAHAHVCTHACTHAMVLHMHVHACTHASVRMHSVTSIKWNEYIEAKKLIYFFRKDLDCSNKDGC